MANCLTMATIDTILTLHKSGHSNREIARLTGQSVLDTISRVEAAAEDLQQVERPLDMHLRLVRAVDRIAHLMQKTVEANRKARRSADRLTESDGATRDPLAGLSRTNAGLPPNATHGSSAEPLTPAW